MSYAMIMTNVLLAMAMAMVIPLLQLEALLLSSPVMPCCYMLLRQVIVADTFTSISSSYLGPQAWCSSRSLVLLATGLLVLLMCFPRNLSALERVSVAAVLGFIYTATAVLARGSQTVFNRPDRWANIQLFHFDIQALYAISIVVFGFNCHANVVGVFYELEHYPHRLIHTLPAT